MAVRIRLDFAGRVGDGAGVKRCVEGKSLIFPALPGKVDVVGSSDAF